MVESMSQETVASAVAENAIDQDNFGEDEYIALVERVATLEGRLEASRKKSLFERLSVWGGFVALLISIITGGYTIFGIVYKSPQLERQAQIEKLRKAIDSLAGLRAEFFEKSKGDPQIIAQLATNKRSILENNATIAVALHNIYPDVLSFSDHMLLGRTLSQLMRRDEAINHTYIAKRIAKNDFERAASEELLGDIFRDPGRGQDLKRVREHYQKSVTLYIHEDQNIFNPTIVGIYFRWLFVESSFGKCKKSNSIVDDVSKYIRSRKISPIEIGKINSAFSNLLSDIRDKCVLKNLIIS